MVWEVETEETPQASLGFYCYDKHHDANQLGQEMVYLSLQILAHYERKSRRESEAEVVEQLCSLACSLWFFQPAFFYCPGPPAYKWHCP